MLGENPLELLHRVNLSEPSIYQPRIRRGQGRIPRFSGFFAVFLEMKRDRVAGCVYILWLAEARCPELVHLALSIPTHPGTHNLSTTDGTKVL